MGQISHRLRQITGLCAFIVSIGGLAGGIYGGQSLAQRIDATYRPINAQTKQAISYGCGAAGYFAGIFAGEYGARGIASLYKKHK